MNKINATLATLAALAAQKPAGIRTYSTQGAVSFTGARERESVNDTEYKSYDICFVVHLARGIEADVTITYECMGIEGYYDVGIVSNWDGATLIDTVFAINSVAHALPAFELSLT